MFQHQGIVCGARVFQQIGDRQKPVARLNMAADRNIQWRSALACQIVRQARTGRKKLPVQMGLHHRRHRDRSIQNCGRKLRYTVEAKMRAIAHKLQRLQRA